MENSKTDKEFHKLLKYEEKKARQREKTRLGPNRGTGARGYGIFKKDLLFKQPDKPVSSRKLSNEPKMKREKRMTSKPTESKTGDCQGNSSCDQSQDPEGTNQAINNHREVIPTPTKEAMYRLDMIKQGYERIAEEAKIEKASIEIQSQTQATND